MGPCVARLTPRNETVHAIGSSPLPSEVLMSDSVSRLTSAYLKRCLDKPHGSEVPYFVSHIANNPSPVWKWVQAALLYQYEGVHDFFHAGGFSGPRNELAAMLDDSLCRLFVSSVPGMVERLLKFDKLVTQQLPNEIVQLYFEQAMRCYVVGLPLATVALARACLEQALREAIPLPHTAQLELDGLIAAAGLTKALAPVDLQMARDVQRLGNQVLHRQGCTDAQAFESIVNVRGVVESLFGPAPDDE